MKYRLWYSTESFADYIIDSIIFYGVGLAHSNHTEKKANEHLEKVDFLIFLYADKTINIALDHNLIFNNA